MALPKLPDRVRFFVGVLAADARLCPLIEETLWKEWGEIDLISEILPFTYTAYYADELGPNPIRIFYAFGGAFDPAELAARKIRSNELEEALRSQANLLLGSDWPRPINLDPGYLAPGKIVLASAKDFYHRIYLSQGIYAEVTLVYRHGRFETFPWTFPDYASGAYFPFFLALRTRLMRERRRDSAKVQKPRTRSCNEASNP